MAEASKIAPQFSTSTCASCGRIARTGTAAALVGTMMIAGVIAPADAADKTGAEQLARQVCQSVIRVLPGVSEFDGCVSSLADSLASASRGRMVAQARDACFAQKSSSVDLNLCLLRAADTRSDMDAIELPDAASVLAGVVDDPQFSKSYFAATPDAKFHREQQACARLGLDPAFGPFAQCVAALQSALQDNDTAGD